MFFGVRVSLKIILDMNFNIFCSQLLKTTFEEFLISLDFKYINATFNVTPDDGNYIFNTEFEILQELPTVIVIFKIF